MVSEAPKRNILKMAFNVALAIAGVWFFVHLVADSGVTIAKLKIVSPGLFTLLVLVSGTVVLLDTLAWQYAVRHVARPQLVKLFGLRVAGDSLTNGLPGGVVLGETYKAVMMRSWFGVSLADNTASLLMVKFGLGFSHAIYCLLGLIFCYSLLEQKSAVTGYENAHYVVLFATIGIGTLMFLPLLLMFRGRTFTDVTAGLAKLPIPPLRRWLELKKDGIASLDQACADVLLKNRKQLIWTFSYLLLGWLVSTGETYVLMAALGLHPTLVNALAIESIGSLFRLVFWVVPSGIGGQDLSFIKLFRLYNLPADAAGAFILIKRVKDLLWIAVGFLLVLLFRRRVTQPNGQSAAVADGGLQDGS